MKGINKVGEDAKFYHSKIIFEILICQLEKFNTVSYSSAGDIALTLIINLHTHYNQGLFKGIITDLLKIG